MAKPKPMVPATTRPVNLVLRSPWSARENPPKDLGYPVDPVNAVEGQRWSNLNKETGTDHSKPTGRKFSSGERGQKLKIQIFGNRTDREVSSYSGSTRKLVRTATPRTVFSKYEVNKPSIHDEDIPLSYKRRWGITVRYSSFSMEALKTNVLIWRMFMSSSMKGSHSSWTKLSGELGSVQKHEFRENSELIQYHTEIVLGAFWKRF